MCPIIPSRTITDASSNVDTHITQCRDISRNEIPYRFCNGMAETEYGLAHVSTHVCMRDDDVTLYAKDISNEVVQLVQFFLRAR